jgi:GT2 family glycosyltransferase
MIARIAVIMASHNRCNKTLACLNALFGQDKSNYFNIAVFLLDDASTDETVNMVRNAFPEVKILHGDGSLYWNGGMRLAFAEAMKEDFDFFLWLNDDTILYDDALWNLFQSYYEVLGKYGCEAVIVGSTRDEAVGCLTYGGVVRRNPFKPLRFEMVTPADVSLECETVNGNCVMIPRIIAKDVGNLDNAFTHAIGDFDYGLKVKERGYTIWVMPGYAGTCSWPPEQGTFLDLRLPLTERLRKISHIKGLPFREWMLFARRYGGPFWFFYGLSPYMRIFFDAFTSRIR